MNAAALKVLFDYNAWAYAQVWACVKQLSEEQFVQEMDYSLGSVRNHMVHVASVDARWWARVRGIAVPDHLEAADFATREDVSRAWSVIYGDIDPFLAQMSDETVQKEITYTSRGQTRTNFAWEILLHVVNHGTDHRAQMLYLLHKLGAMTVEQDFVYYLRDELPPRGQIGVTAQAMQALFAYDAYATSRLVSECLAVLSDAQLDRNLGYSHKSVRAQLGHLMMASKYWLDRAFGTDLDAGVQTLFAAGVDLAADVSDAQLMEPVEYRTSQGREAANIRWELLWHLVNHNTDHRAQTLAMLHELDAPTFEQDLMIYFWALAEAE